VGALKNMKKPIDHNAALLHATRVQYTTSSGPMANLAQAYIELTRERAALREKLQRLLKRIDETLKGTT
jgi:uncharacterized protein involved in exopolysaccharide biosynthesis